MAGAASTAGGGASGGKSAPEASLGSWPKADMRITVKEIGE
ncbi:hypothetical protein ACJEM5_17680 [Escherichia coli]|nr:hypothetical protein [Escherichia coli]